jgi:hypothetical protein
MKILFSNLVHDAVISATSTDSNYPVGNLKSSFLRKRWQSTANSDTIVVTLASPESVSSLFIGYTNSTLPITVRLYNGLTLLQTTSITDSLHFNSVLLDKIELDLSASSPVYLGGIGFGVAYDIDPPESFWEETFDDRSIVSESQSGQVLQEYVEPLKIYDFNIPTLDRTEARAIEAQYRLTGAGYLVWLDPMTDDLEPMYCRLTDPVTVNKNKRQYAAKLTFKEAR